MNSFWINITGGGTIDLLTEIAIAWTLCVYIVIAFLTARMPNFDFEKAQKWALWTAVPSTMVAFLVLLDWAEAGAAARPWDDDNVGGAIIIFAPVVGWLLVKLAAIPIILGDLFSKTSTHQR